jgi:hypothetical protein
MLTACDEVSNDVGRILITYFDLKTLSVFGQTLCAIGIPDRLFFDHTGLFRLTQFAEKIATEAALPIADFMKRENTVYSADVRRKEGS